MFTSPFQQNISTTKTIPPSTQIIIVADLFQEDYAGGAELTTEALIESCPFNILKIRSRDVTIELLEQGSDRYWIFGNMAQLKAELLPSIIANLKYSILEYDYKFCTFRSIERHEHETGNACDCHVEMHGKIMSAFFYGAQSIWWMSEEQEQRYLTRFPFLEKKQRTVLSSVFNENFFSNINSFKEKYANVNREGWIVLGSQSWIKGATDAIQHCKDNDLKYETVWNMPYEHVLEKLAQAKGFVYLPRGGDTCPRMVIEAKLLGCELVLNGHVQHAMEMWFNTDDELDTLSYLYAARERFWNAIATHVTEPTLSGYTTIYNGNERGYPWKISINSMLGFCDEVVVIDGGSNDGTWEELQQMANNNNKLKISQHVVDWDDDRFAYESDGAQKARARAKCTGCYCWQMDVDEIVKSHDYPKIRTLIKTFPNLADVLDLPIVEYWGSKDKIRVDVNPWKWRVSANKSSITHGIPKELRAVDENGKLYAKPGTDSCDYINMETFERIPHMMFYTNDIHAIRLAALQGDKNALTKYTEWYQRAITMLPTVYHYSWLDIPKKIKSYKKYWSRFWCSMYNISQEDTSENNMFFNKPWSQVTNEEIEETGKRLAEKMGGWIFHNKINWEANVPHITLDIPDGE